MSTNPNLTINIQGVSVSSPGPAPLSSTSTSTSISSQSSTLSTTGSSAPILSTRQPKIKLAETMQENRRIDTLADLFAILTAIQHLEVAYMRDAISANTYQSSCGRLLSQYRTWKQASGNEIGSVEDFAKTYRLDCPAALSRIAAGVPATVQHGGGAGSGGRDGAKDKSLLILIAGERFITAMDSLKLNMRAVDELFPLVNDIMESIAKFETLPTDHPARSNVAKWTSQLSKMRAADELTDDQSRQMYFDLETAYTQFRKYLEMSGK